jgi:hypothetical protein
MAAPNAKAPIICRRIRLSRNQSGCEPHAALRERKRLYRRAATSVRDKRDHRYASPCVLHHAEPLAFHSLATKFDRDVAVSAIVHRHPRAKIARCSFKYRIWSRVPGTIQSLSHSDWSLLPQRMPLRRTQPTACQAGAPSRGLALVKLLATITPADRWCD